MSNVMYPISLVEALEVSKVERVQEDEFEDGGTYANSPWPNYYFKRKFRLSHGPLTVGELRYLRSFWQQRSGRADSFWFRDNINRDGNASVRFANFFNPTWSAGRRVVPVEMFEVAAIRALPDKEELVTAAGATPLFWYDANREIYFEHLGTAYQDTAASVYDRMEAYRAAWQSGSLSLGDILAQYQHYDFNGARWALTGSNVAALTGAQPAATVFCIARHGTIASKEVLFGVGAMGAGKAVGIAVSASNYYEPWLGGSETWGTARFLNSANNTWRSFAVTWAAANDTANFYVNGAAALTESETRGYTAGPASLGAAIDGTLPGTGDVAHALVFAGQLSFAQVKAVHNLLGYQYGLTSV